MVRPKGDRNPLFMSFFVYNASNLTVTCGARAILDRVVGRGLAIVLRRAPL